MPLQVYSTLTRKKEPFHKQPGETVTMYVCGPTVYKPSHIGHMVGPVIFDTVKRYLTYLGYNVKWIVNITDVDDKLINRARELNTTVTALAEKMTADYFECLKALNIAVESPAGIDHFPRATQHIAGMIDVINDLIKKDIAYEVDDGVYFDVSKDEDYGKLTNRDPEQMEAGARLEPNPKKRNPGDFALWKSKPGEPAEVQFESPFRCGRGRPGWHIECTCMAIKELGETLDIHGGGLDLQFPHHENELAQSESWTGKAFARVWMHNGLLKMGSAKMAGSVGNVVNIADLLKRHSADTVRFLLLSTHYRSPIEYSEERLDGIQRSLESFYRYFERFHNTYGIDFYSLTPSMHDTGPVHGPVPAVLLHLNRIKDVFLAGMADDFNTAAASSYLFDLLRELNKELDARHPLDHPGHEFVKRGTQLLRDLASMLGVFPVPRAKKTLVSAVGTATMNFSATATGSAVYSGEALEQANQNAAHAKIVEGLMQLLLDLRGNLRGLAKDAAKDNPLKKPLFDQTDLIRKRLGELGVTLEDRATGTTWRVG
jgi:cysteinyl-tRNA synthetase